MDSYFPLTNLVAAAICFLALLSTAFFYRKSRSYQENKTVASSSLSLLDTPSSLPRNRKYHVFPSFHGVDVRTNFLSHVLKELRSKGINLFIDDNIERSKSIGPELIEAIKGSRIAIVFLSKNYASSTWCLNELVEIMKSREKFGQTVMPLFYQVDPTDVKKQTGDFGKVLGKTCRGKKKEDIQKWKHALTEVAQIAGYHSTNWKSEAEMISAIATEVSNKLNLSAPCSDFDGFVGMESHMTDMEPLLQLESSNEVRKIGILGPPGIGKTTIARSLFNKHSQEFQLSVFIDNIKREYAIPTCSDDYSVKLYLQKKFMSQLTNDTCVNVSHLGVVQDRLQDKKVLVVLDDVDHLEQVEAMAKETYWFGPGSRIIIATQDQMVLRASGVKHIHRVMLPSYGEACQMFCMYAFGQKYSNDGFGMLVWEVINLVGRLPLGLKVIGSYFRGMSKQSWIEALASLKAHLNQDGKIAGVLKLSYDALNGEEKNLFLHIACFFDYEKVDIVESCFVNVRHGLRVLVEKSLIYIEQERIRMATLLVQLGRKIVREEFSEPGKRRFLNDAKDIEEVLSDDKNGSNNVIGIKLDEKECVTCTNERAFKRLSNLQYLRIKGKGVNPQSVNHIPQKLRVLIWSNFHMSCFPSSFNPQFIVKLEMWKSWLEKLWEGIKPLNNLKWMDLSGSDRLKELPDLSTATNLQELNLIECDSLMKLSSSIGNAINLIKLNLSHCSSLVEIPSSIGNAINLRELNLKYCVSLVGIPSSITTITSLKIIDLSYCSSLVELPFNIETVLDPRKIVLRGCSSLVELPFSIGNAIDLEELDLRYCSSLIKLPSSVRNLGRLRKLDLRGCSELEVNLANLNLESLQELDLRGCSLLKIYHESSTGIQELDPRIGGRISRLRTLALNGMKNLVSLPLPDSLCLLDAKDCESLERLDCAFRNPDIRLLNFANCFKLNQEAKDLIIHTSTEQVPMCFTYRSFGSSVTVKLEQKPPGKSTKFKACFILGGEEGKWECEAASVCCSITSGGNALTACYKVIEDIYPGHLYTFEVEVETEKVTSTELVFEFDLSYSHEIEASRNGRPSRYEQRTFKTLEVKECGILQLLPEVPLLNFTDDYEDYEPSDTELVREDDGHDKMLLLTL